MRSIDSQRKWVEEKEVVIKRIKIKQDDESVEARKIYNRG